MERRESWEGREGVEGLLGVAGGWMRWASDGRSGDDMALSLMRGPPEEETLPGDCQWSSGAGDSEDAADVYESSLGGVLVDDGRPYEVVFNRKPNYKRIPSTVGA